jgi:dTDP-4-dehydrorhamnose 3,5-epimerase
VRVEAATGAVETAIPGCVLLPLSRHEDERGDFVKVFRRDAFAGLGLDPAVAEVYWSTSRHGVVRGLHFQSPPHEHAKTVTVLRGEVHDVVVDLRVGSPAYGRALQLALAGDDPSALHLPPGCAHGFQVVSDDALVAYLVGTQHAPSHDEGIRWDSVGADWPVADAIVSARDAAFPTLAEFPSPFRMA